ncbi:SPOR domain-containing protein [Roseovarius sp.]|uniref:SPOR domain-containing protein n=1 Tax=Roseovarius sp. TaxID=1486281 RepID=UPI003B5BB1F6
MAFQWTGKGARARLITASSAIALVLSGCTEGGEFGLFKSQAGGDTEDVTSADNSVKLIERDVEAPDVFQVTDKGLWDGRPSLGGVWVAHPDVQEPERVIIRNTKNGKFVIGALFRRERSNPGPILQVSSDAADALGMLAGAPSQLNVTALRRESAPDPEALAAAETEGEAGTLAPASVEQTTLEPLAGAAAAIESAEAAEPVRPATQTAGATAAVATEPAPAPTPAAATPVLSGSSLSKPYLQIGIFSVEQNARNTATAMRQEGMVPIVKKQSSQGKTFWRVIVGPAQSKSEQSVLLKKVKDVGFDDAYAVTN